MAKQSKNKSETPKGEMELRKATPASALNPFEAMEHMFENFLPTRWGQRFRGDWPSWSELEASFEGRTPRIDIVDRDEEVVVRAEVPGIDKKDLEVSVTDNTVTVKGSTKHEEKEERGDYYRCEISRGEFSRTVALPANVDSAKAKAAFKDGVLELTVPKVEKTRRHSVSID